MKTAVVLGAYGLIGSACLGALKEAGFAVVGIGRSRSAALRCDPDIAWEICDIATADAATWRRIFAGADVVVNASGALQDGARDSLAAIHDLAIARMIEALEGGETRFIQISAAGVSAAAPTEFFRSKARGDERLMASPFDWVLLRPTLVIGADAYGGTALLRGVAAFPGLYPRVLPQAPIQTVWLGDVARAVVQAAQGSIASRTVAALTEAEVRGFAETVMAFRHWLGLPRWKWVLDVPLPLLRLVGRGADLLGWLGWRSPLRSNAILSLSKGVTGSAEAWAAAGGAPCRPLPETLALISATAQERAFARLFLLLPLAIGTLALFWIASGVVSLLRVETAMAILTERGAPEPLALLTVIGGGLVDAALGIGVLVRRWTRRACFGMIGISAVYLAGSLVAAADLWLDPLGPLVKVLPSIILALMVGLLLDER